MDESQLLGSDQDFFEKGDNANINEDVLDFDDKTIKTEDDDIDLYDEAIALNNSGNEDFQKTSFGRKPSVSLSTSNTSVAVASSSTSSSYLAGKYHCYIGNLTWWTTDADMLVNIASLGVVDLMELKFFENRNSGQSKGFVLAAVASEASLKNLMENLPNRTIHGNKPNALPYTKQSLAKLEEIAAKVQNRPDVKKKEDNCVNMGTIRIGAPPMMNRGPQAQMGPAMTPLLGRPIAPPGVPTQMMQGSAPMMQMGPGARPLMPAQPLQIPPQPLMGPMQGMRPGMSYGAPPQPLMGALRPGLGMPPPGAHVNPNVFPMAPLAEAEFEEIMARNRTVSASAISRATADAHAGDVKAAVETLQTAITLLKGSRAAHDERCRVLINQLDDTLRGIDKASYHGSRSRSYRERRSRSRSRDRKSRRRRSRSRSDSRSRSPRHRSSRHY